MLFEAVVVNENGLGLEQEALVPAFARRGECAEFKKSREATFEKAQKGQLVKSRSFLIDGRAALLLFSFSAIPTAPAH